MFVCPGVEDEMAFALERSRREQSSQPPRQSQHPLLRPSNSSSPNPALRSYSAAPFYHCPDATEEEEDEDLQMAPAYSLSEMQAQQQAEDVISGAEGGRGGGKGAGQKNKDQKEEPDNSNKAPPRLQRIDWQNRVRLEIQKVLLYRIRRMTQWQPMGLMW